MSARRGFTLIELLIVVSVIAVLSGIMIAVMNVQAQRDRAADSIRLSNLEQIVEAVEGFYAVEGSFPENKDTAGTPLGVYITSWPDGAPPGAVYHFDSESSPPEFGVLVLSSRDTVTYKYNSEWGKIRECSTAGAADPANLLDEDECN